jgi:hypothetical protein
MSYDVQSSGPDATVRVNAGTYHQTGEPQTDFIITEPGYPDDHRHIVFDQYGNQVYDQINPNH